jgi:uncharacterized protein YjbJ (UPF0337 family)
MAATWEQIAGDRKQLVGKPQEKYGWSREEAERHVETFLAEVDVWTSP